eukprot:507151-Hanusia_phi.AAC.1
MSARRLSSIREPRSSRGAAMQVAARGAMSQAEQRQAGGSSATDKPFLPLLARSSQRLDRSSRYYVNGPPHMGSAYPTIAVDVLADFYRMK